MDYRFRIAQRYLFSPKRVTLISVITGISMVGVTLGVTALIVVLSVMNGFFDFVRDMLLAFDPHVRILSVEERGITEADSLIALLQPLEGVDRVSPYVEGKALIVPQAGSAYSKVVIVRGVDTSTLDALQEGNGGAVGMGSFVVERTNGVPGIIVGLGLNRVLDVLPAGENMPASQVGLVSAQGMERMLSSFFGGTAFARFEVRGLYAMETVSDENHVYISLEEAQRLFQMSNQVSGIDLRLDDLDRAAAVKAALSAQLDPARFQVQTWYDLKRTHYNVMQFEKWGASAVLLLIVVVAAFNIVASLTMVVIEKRRDVGVLQAMGVSRKNIRRIFLNEGILIGLGGAGTGLVLGLGLALLQQHYGLVPIQNAESFLLDAYPVAIQWFDVATIALTSMSLCVLAAYYPAHRAAAIAPAEAVSMDG